MAKILRLVVLCGFCAFSFSLTAHAQVMGICSGWVPNYSSYCTPTSNIGLTNSSNPTFNVAINGGSNSEATTSTEIVVLVPWSSTSSSLTFSATFTPSNGGSPATISATAFPTTFTSSSGSLVSFLGYNSFPGSQNYKFNNINAVSTISGVTGYTAFVLDASSLGLTPGSGYVTVSFSNFSNGSGFPVGTIILAYGNDANGNIVYFSPLTDGLQTTVPEPMTLGLFGTGLLGIALMVRRRRMRQES